MQKSVSFETSRYLDMCFDCDVKYKDESSHIHDFIHLIKVVVYLEETNTIYMISKHI